MSLLFLQKKSSILGGRSPPMTPPFRGTHGIQRSDASLTPYDPSFIFLEFLGIFGNFYILFTNIKVKYKPY